MNFLHFFMILLTLFLVTQCQIFETRSETPWIWSNDEVSNQNSRERFRNIRKPVWNPLTSTGNPSIPTREPSPRVCPGCPVTQEYNPICGSDNATYRNLNALKCANTCGPNIKVMFYAVCRPIL